MTGTVDMDYKAQRETIRRPKVRLHIVTVCRDMAGFTKSLIIKYYSARLTDGQSSITKMSRFVWPKFEGGLFYQTNPV